jgi:acyl-coenzyme A thioesterase PaaI-like protein
VSDAQPGFPRFHDVFNSEVSPRRAEARRLAETMRRMIDRLVVTDAPIDVLEQVARQMETSAAILEEHGELASYEGFAEAANSGDPHAHFDRSPIVGHSNPMAPPVRLDQVGDVIRGTATFGKAYEGPPGCVHGGWIAAAFDEVLGMTQSMSGNPGMTAFLHVNYRQPTPLHVELAFEGELIRVEGRKIFTEGRVRKPDGQVTAEAEALFVSVDFAKLFGRSPMDVSRPAQE